MDALPLSDRDRWLLQACLRKEPEDVKAAFAAWRPFANPAQMQGRELRLMPLLHANLRRVGIDDARTAWMRGQAKHIWLTGAVRTGALLRSLDILAAAEIPAILIKGAALLARWRKEMETRPMGDFDVLIPRDRVRQGLTILRSNGWSAAKPDLLTDDDLDRFHGLSVHDQAGSAVDLHWRPAEIVLDPSHAEGVFDRAVGREINRRPVRVASLADHLFVLLAHAFNDTVMQRVDWVSETVLLLRLGAEEDWNWSLFSQLCRRYRTEYWAVQAMSVVEEIAPEPLPGGLRQVLDGWAGRDLRSQKYEVDLRGRPASCSRDLLVRRRGEVARGRSPVIEHCTLGPGPSLAEAQRRRPHAADFVLVGRKGLDLRHDSAGGSFLYGWSVPEESGRWSDAEVAMLALRVQAGRPGDFVRVYLKCIVLGERELTVTVWAGGDPVIWTLPPIRGRVRRTLRGRLVAWGADAVLPLWFRFDGLLTPQERMRFDTDHRPLGIYLQKLRIFRNRPVGAAAALVVLLREWYGQVRANLFRFRDG